MCKCAEAEGYKLLYWSLKELLPEGPIACVSPIPNVWNSAMSFLTTPWWTPSTVTSAPCFTVYVDWSWIVIEWGSVVIGLLLGSSDCVTFVVVCKTVTKFSGTVALCLTVTSLPTPAVPAANPLIKVVSESMFAWAYALNVPVSTSYLYNLSAIGVYCKSTWPPVSTV